jgi:eukaryotic-like serine/threonine-protein kinase
MTEPIIRTCLGCGKLLDDFSSRTICVACVLKEGLSTRETGAEGLQSDEGASQSPGIGTGGARHGDDEQVRRGVLARFGDYELLEEIARGGMGIVYKARQVSLNRVVALKMILAGQFASKQEVLRFRVEAEAAANLRHPNIVAIFETGEHQGQHFFSMEYVGGPNLSQLVGNRPLNADRAARCTMAIAQAVHYAHTRNTLHRDLKPSNVLMDAEDQPRITDFGLMRRLRGPHGLTMTGQMLGSPNFMPPEQCGVLSNGPSGDNAIASAEPEIEGTLVTSARARATAGPRSDVYGIGAILYHLLTARPPFQAETVQEVLLQLRDHDPVSPRLLNSSIPRDLETICTKCLQKELHQRYATAQEVADDLERFLQNEPIHARPVARLECAWRWCRRKPALASSLATASVLLAFLLIGGPFLTYRVNQARKAETKERLRAEQSLYAADMLLAQAALDEGNLGKARHLLKQYSAAGIAGAAEPPVLDPDLRQWEWRYLWGQTRGDELYTLGAHSKEVLALAISPKGEVASVSSDAVLKLWDMRSRRLENSIPASGTPLFLKYDAAAELIVGCGAVSTSGVYSIVISNPERGKKKLFETGRDSLIGADFSAEQQLLAAFGKDWVGIWNTASGELLAAPPNQNNDIRQGAIAFSGDGEFLAYQYGDSTVNLWDVKNGRLAASLEGHSNTAVSLAFSPDGKWLISGSLDRSAIVWDLRAREGAKILAGHAGGVTALAFSSDGARLVSGSADQRIKIWATGTWREVATLQGHDSVITCVTVSHDGAEIISGSKDQSVRLWGNQPKPSGVLLKPLEPNFYHAEFSPAGESLRVYYGSSDTLFLFDAATLEETHRFNPVASGFTGEFLAAAPGGRRLANGGGEISLWTINPPKLIDRLSSGPASMRPLRRMVFSPNGRLLAAARADGLLEVWDVNERQQLHTIEIGSKSAFCLRFSADSSLLAMGSTDGLLEIWDIRRKQRLASLPRQQSALNDVRITRDNSFVLSAGADGRLMLWNLSSRQGVSLGGPMSSYNCVAESTDGERAAAGAEDGTIRIWDLGSRQEVAVLRGHAQAVRRLAFLSDGDSLVSVSRDVMRVWRAAPLAQIDAQERSERVK